MELTEEDRALLLQTVRGAERHRRAQASVGPTTEQAQYQHAEADRLAALAEKLLPRDVWVPREDLEKVLAQVTPEMQGRVVAGISTAYERLSRIAGGED
jgi:hypothetical protein